MRGPFLVRNSAIWLLKQRTIYAAKCRYLERETGIEPATNGLGSRYSTIELLPLDAPIITPPG